MPETDHSTCAGEITGRMEAMGVEVTISTKPPVVAGPYTTDGFTCPHDVTFWVEPTGEQIAKWAKGGVK